MWVGASPDPESGDGAGLAASDIVEEAASDQTNEETETVTSGGLVVTGPEEFMGSEELAYLEEQVAELEAQDVDLGIVVLDLETGYSIEYNAEEQLYPASSVKAAYCAMVCEKYGGAGELAEVWEEIFRCGTSGEDGSDELVGALSATNYTALGGLLRDEFEVWAKPGWYPTDEYDLTSTNDAGVVFSDCGPYVIVVMTGMNSDLYGLLPLVDALNAAHGALCGGSTELLYDETVAIPGY